MARTKAFDEEKVLDKAMTLFWSKGYHDTSMQDLVEYLGLSRSSIYATFEKGKYSLFLASLKRYRDKARKVEVTAVINKEIKLEDFLKVFF